jgi:hypothetical protein
MGGVEAQLLRNSVYSGVVIARVIKHKVANCARANTEFLQDREHDLSYLLTRVSACQLGQCDG